MGEVRDPWQTHVHVVEASDFVALHGSRPAHNPTSVSLLEIAASGKADAGSGDIAVA